MFVLVLLIIAITSLSAVSAADLNTTDEVVGDEVSVDGDLEQTDDVVLDANTGTFTQLNSLVSKGSTVSLQKDYAYVCPDDSDYQDGITINREVTINGNGHTIYCNGARAFIIGENAKVTINGVHFVNNGEANYYNGGIIYNYGYLAVIDCEFTNSTTAAEGGAIYSRSQLLVDSCNFTYNYADSDDITAGGAISSYGYMLVYNSYFLHNAAKYGGAICANGSSLIMQSELSWNSALYRGGAVINDVGSTTIVQTSILFMNSADYGGALYDCVANLTYFDYNIAYQKGHHMAYGVALDSLFYMDSTNKNYNDNIFLDTKVAYNVKLSCSKTTINYSEKLAVKVIDIFGTPVPGITVKVKIKTSSGFKYFTGKTNANGIAYISITAAPGTYKNVVITSGSAQMILGGSKTISKMVIKKETPKITASAKTFKLKATKKYTITVKGSKGVAVKNTNVKIKVNGVTYSAKTNANGQATFTLSKLNRKGSFSSTITIAANTNYNKATKTVTIKVA